MIFTPVHRINKLWFVVLIKYCTNTACVIINNKMLRNVNIFSVDDFHGQHNSSNTLIQAKCLQTWITCLNFSFWYFANPICSRFDQVRFCQLIAMAEEFCKRCRSFICSQYCFYINTITEVSRKLQISQITEYHDVIILFTKSCNQKY